MVGVSEAEIFSAHLAIAQDKGYRDKIRAVIEKTKANAEYAVYTASEEYAKLFEAMSDPYLAQRAEDMRAVGSRIVSTLYGKTKQRLALKEPVILLAEELTPGDTISLDRRYILGFVTSKGGMNSHTAILARALGIPAIVGAKLPAPDCHGKRACLDGFTGNLILEPDAFLMQRMRAKKANWQLLQEARPSLRVDGMEFWVNAGSLREVQYAAGFQVVGVGLFRTELLFMGRNAPPDEEEQFCCYRDAVVAMGQRPVVFRLADLGGDKSEPYMEMPQEENPAMGMRGVRFLLSRPKYLHTQLRALCRASAYGELRILIPMVTSSEEIVAIKDWVVRVQNELYSSGERCANRILVGAMVETPAAALCAGSLCRYADFISIGTNDLTQYTLAADRQIAFDLEENVEENAGWKRALSDPRPPAVCRLIDMTAAAAHEANVPVCVCGEMAGDPQMLDFFRQAGIHALSISSVLLQYNQTEESHTGSLG
jgi:phosphotransferase system enzyme I (PtsI)